MFTATLFPMAKIWKKPKCPSKKWMDIENVVYTNIYTHTMKYYSAIKNWNNAICSNMGGSRDYHTKWSKSDKDKYHMIQLIYGI